MAATESPRLLVVFASERFSGERTFPKTPKGEKEAESFLRSIQKSHVKESRPRFVKDRLSVQITTI